MSVVPRPYRWAAADILREAEKEVSSDIKALIYTVMDQTDVLAAICDRLAEIEAQLRHQALS